MRQRSESKGSCYVCEGGRVFPAQGNLSVAACSYFKLGRVLPVWQQARRHASEKEVTDDDLRFLFAKAVEGSKDPSEVALMRKAILAKWMEWNAIRSKGL